MKLFLAFILFLIALRCFSAWPGYWPLTTNGVVTNDLRQLFEDQIAAVNERCLATWTANPVITNLVVVTNGASSTTNSVVITNDTYDVSPLYVSYTVPYSTGLAIQSYSVVTNIDYTNSTPYTNVYTFTNWVAASTNLLCSNWVCRLGTNVVVTNMVYAAAFVPQIDAKIAELVAEYVQTNVAADFEGWYAAVLASSTNRLPEDYFPANGRTIPAYWSLSNIFVNGGPLVGEGWSATNGHASVKWLAYPQRLVGEQILGEFQIYATNEYATNGHTYKQLTTRWADAVVVDLTNASISAWSNNGPANIKYRIINPNTNGNQSIAGATFSATGSVYHWVQAPLNAPAGYVTNAQFQYFGGDSGTAYNVNFYDILGAGSSFHLDESDDASHPCNGASIQILWTPAYNVYGDVGRRPTAESLNARYRAINALRYTTIGINSTTGALGQGENSDFTNSLAGAQAVADADYRVTNTTFQIGGGRFIRAAYDQASTQTLYRVLESHGSFKVYSDNLSPYVVVGSVSVYFTADTNTFLSSQGSEFDGMDDGYVRGLNFLTTIISSSTTIWYGAATHGSTAIPATWPPTPSAHTSGVEVSTSRGYKSKAEYGIVDWQFQYRDW